MKIILNFSYDAIESMNMSKLGKLCEAFTVKGSTSVIIEYQNWNIFCFYSNTGIISKAINLSNV